MKHDMSVDELIKKQDELNEKLKLAEAEGEEHYAEGNVSQLVSFTIDDVEYGVDILMVHEILRIPAITRLPNTPEFIKGVINLRGNVIPVVDARKRFGFPVVGITDLTRIIVIQTGERKVGLLVDNVYQVVRIPEGNIDEPSDLIEGVSEYFISGIGRLKDRLIVILNMDNIIFTEEEIDEMNSVQV